MVISESEEVWLWHRVHWHVTSLSCEVSLMELGSWLVMVCVNGQGATAGETVHFTEYFQREGGDIGREKTSLWEGENPWFYSFPAKTRRHPDIAAQLSWGIRVSRPPTSCSVIISLFFPLHPLSPSPVSSWQVHITTSFECLTVTPSGMWPWRHPARAANPARFSSPGESALVANGGKMTSVSTVWTLLRRSCTQRGTRPRTSLL